MKKNLFLICLLMVGLFAFNFSKRLKESASISFYSPLSKAVITRKAHHEKKVSAKMTAAARTFVIQQDYNQRFCFLIDMSLPSGSKRFFIYNFGKDSVINAGLVTHGNCNQYWLEGQKYGNDPGCGCTSLGRYKIGKPYYGKFGLACKLYGLDSTNDKAFERYVVLHSHSCVPDKEREDDICQSQGCPTLSPAFLTTVQSFISGSKKPVLLWIYE